MEDTIVFVTQKVNQALQSFHGGSLENTRAYSPFKRIVNSQCKMTINLRKIHNCIFTYSFKNFGHILAIQCICRFPEKRDIFLIKPRGSSLGFPANENFRAKNANIFVSISQTFLRNFAF